MTSKPWSFHRLMSPLLFAGLLAGTTAANASSSPAVRPGFAAIPASVQPTVDTDVGAFTSASMTIQIVLAPSNQAQISDLLSDVYDQSSSHYQQWLAKGEFNSRFAPNSAQVAALTAYLQSSGLTVQPSASPFLLRASGPSSLITAAFNTTLRNYVNPRGVSYFSNGASIQLPSSLVPAVLGVVGVSNTIRMQGQYRRPSKGHTTPIPACEAPYPTAAQLANAVLNGVGFPFGYGGGPGCNGLTPSQDNSLYGAPNIGNIGKGQGVTLGLFELSAYQESDIVTWAQTFLGSSYTPPLVNINVDGGPLAPICPTGDQCPPEFNGFSGDIEVDADIEMQLAIAPAVKHLIVYNAPNDFTGQTTLDELAQIANDDIADSISSSWAVCENDSGPAQVQAENIIFVQMALQGQSMFGAEGDTGAFSCIRSDGTTILNLLDPPAQPWVTSVGGTSFENFNPNADPNPRYPLSQETVWNFLNLCNSGPGVDGLAGFDWCAAGGAGGGGNSEFWGRPIYQFGFGITNQFTTFGNGTTQCSLAKAGTPCRETPDISVNADENTPYAEFCTGNANTPFSVCGEFSQFQTPAGWFGIGGTSLSSPFMSAVIGDRDGFFHRRTGNANPLLYALYRTDYFGFFHDITGFGQVEKNNGFFPTTFGYDLATGIGTPKMGALITGFPQF